MPFILTHSYPATAPSSELSPVTMRDLAHGTWVGCKVDQIKDDIIIVARGTALAASSVKHPHWM
jgi:hypothetical protein